MYCVNEFTLSNVFQYKNCIQRFYKHDDVEVLQYLGRAYLKAGMLKESKAVFLKVSECDYYLYLKTMLI